MEMKTEALALADELKHGVWYKNPYIEDKMDEASAMIRRLVERIDSQENHLKLKDDFIATLIKPLSDDEILHIYNESYRNTLMGIDPLVFAREIEERHGIK